MTLIGPTAKVLLERKDSGLRTPSFKVGSPPPIPHAPPPIVPPVPSILPSSLLHKESEVSSGRSLLTSDAPSSVHAIDSMVKSAPVTERKRSLSSTPTTIERRASLSTSTPVERKKSLEDTSAPSLIDRMAVAEDLKIRRPSNSTTSVDSAGASSTERRQSLSSSTPSHGRRSSEIIELPVTKVVEETDGDIAPLLNIKKPLVKEPSVTEECTPVRDRKLSCLSKRLDEFQIERTVRGKRGSMQEELAKEVKAIIKAEEAKQEENAVAPVVLKREKSESVDKLIDSYDFSLARALLSKEIMKLDAMWKRNMQFAEYVNELRSEINLPHISYDLVDNREYSTFSEAIQDKTVYLSTDMKKEGKNVKTPLMKYFVLRGMFMYMYTYVCLYLI
jgi:hypothetical protein